MATDSDVRPVSRDQHAQVTPFYQLRTSHEPVYQLYATRDPFYNPGTPRNRLSGCGRLASFRPPSRLIATFAASSACPAAPGAALWTVSLPPASRTASLRWRRLLSPTRLLPADSSYHPPYARHYRTGRPCDVSPPQGRRRLMAVDGIHAFSSPFLQPFLQPGDGSMPLDLLWSDSLAMPLPPHASRQWSCVQTADGRRQTGSVKAKNPSS
jgi:hypothetical protein